MTFDQAQQRYQRDATFHAFVDGIYDAIMTMQLTPGEARDAAMLASIKFERSRLRHVFFPKDLDLHQLFTTRKLEDREVADLPDLNGPTTILDTPEVP